MTEADVLSLAEVARPTAPRTGRRAHLLWISLMRSMHARSLGFCRRVTWLAYASWKELRLLEFAPARLDTQAKAHSPTREARR
jgi:hypothetical protein